MHTIIADECTGCELCLPPCPVDCIDLIPIKQTIDDWKWSLPGTTPASTEPSPELGKEPPHGH
jgi:electron transport complex protein RnfB